MPYLLTFRYGTYLPGHPDGTDQRQNRHLPPSKPLETHTRRAMRQPENQLQPHDAELALAAFKQVCQTRHWELIAAHVRTNHVQLIADGIQEPLRAAQAADANVKPMPQEVTRLRRMRD